MYIPRVVFESLGVFENVNRTNLAIIMSYVVNVGALFNVSSCSFWDGSTIVNNNNFTKHKGLNLVQKSLSFVEITCDSIAHLKDQKAGGQLCLNLQHALIQLSH